MVGDPTKWAAAVTQPVAGRLDQLDGLRGAAVTLVVAYHATWLTAGWGPRMLPGGFVGVDVFFVLSGFLITRLLLAEVRRSNRIDLLAFTARRFRRLSPALAAMTFTTITVVWVSGHLPSARHAVVSGVSTLLYASNFQQAGAHHDLLELSHTWSLAIEGQFYLVWPPVVLGLTAWGLHRSRRGRIAWVVALGLLLLGVTLRRSALWTDQEQFLPLYIGTLTRLDGVLIGCTLGLASAWGWLTPQVGRALRLPALLGLAIIAGASLWSETGDVHMYRDHGLVAVALGAGAIVASSVIEPTWGPNRIWTSPVLRWIGLRSYSLYLWHVPVFLTVARNLGESPVWVKVLTGGGVAMALSEISYRWVESRWRHPRPGLLA